MPWPEDKGFESEARAPRHHLIVQKANAYKQIKIDFCWPKEPRGENADEEYVDAIMHVINN